MSKGSGAKNGIWSVAQQIANIGLNGLFGIVLARFVEVAEFGIFSYAITLASLGVAVMSSGLQALAVREYVARPSSSISITAAIVFIRELMALGVYGLLIGVSVVSGSGATLAVVIACLAIFARVFDAPDLWYQANFRVKVTALIRICVGVIFFAARVAILFLSPSILLLLVVFVLEQAINSALIYVAYSRAHPHQRVAVMPERAEVSTLSRRSLPLVISSLANQVNLKIDVIILQALRGSVSVGTYSAAARLSELLYVIPVAYMTATFPTLLNTRAKHGATSREYSRQLQLAFDGAFWFGMLVVAVTLLTAKPIVLLLFGPEYQESVDILKIHVLASPFVFMAAVFSKWIVAENRLWLSLGRHVAGAIAAVVLNLIFIPLLGGIGAAIATVVSYVMASYIFCFFTKSTRGIALKMTLTVLAPARFAIRVLNRRKDQE